MAKTKLTKGELKRQRDALKQFRHYLPTLQLKKQQLQGRILETRRALAEKDESLRRQEEAIRVWVGLLADPALDDVLEIKQWVVPSNDDLVIATLNVAGANIPVLKGITFKADDYDLYATPFWVDRGLAALREYVRTVIERQVVRQQVLILEKELRVTTQRVNLFEKVKIPECQENIRVIRIYLGDQQSNAVGISKVAKKKIEEQTLVAVA